MVMAARDGWTLSMDKNDEHDRYVHCYWLDGVRMTVSQALAVATASRLAISPRWHGDYRHRYYDYCWFCGDPGETGVISGIGLTSVETRMIRAGMSPLDVLLPLLRVRELTPGELMMKGSTDA
jgi:hypothetical protein